MNERIIFKHPDEDLVMVFLEAGIGGTRERIYVAGLVLSHIRNTRDIIPMVSEHLGDWTCFIQDSFRLKHESEGVVAASSYSTSREHKSYGNEDSKVWKGLGRLSRGYDCGDLQQAAFN